VVSDTGEKRRSWEGRKPTASAPVVGTAATSPPLSATPGGVCSVHAGLPDGRRKSSQKVLVGSSRCPIGSSTAEVDGEVTPEATGRLGAAGASAGVAVPDVPDPHAEVTAATTSRATVAAIGTVDHRLTGASPG
jgi:hypothetical protein